MVLPVLSCDYLTDGRTNRTLGNNLGKILQALQALYGPIHTRNQNFLTFTRHFQLFAGQLITL